MINRYTHHCPTYISCSGHSVLYTSHLPPHPKTLILSKIEPLPDPRSSVLLIYLYRFKSQVIDTCNTACCFIWVFCLLGILRMAWGLGRLCLVLGALSFELLLGHVNVSAIFLLEIGGSIWDSNMSEKPWGIAFWLIF